VKRKQGYTLAAGDGGVVAGDNAPCYLIVDEVAALLRCSKKTVYRLVDRDPPCLC
jgi:hypothetical protein